MWYPPAGGNLEEWSVWVEPVTQGGSKLSCFQQRVMRVYHTRPSFDISGSPLLRRCRPQYTCPPHMQGLVTHTLHSHAPARAMQDISTKYASALFGITNAGASLAGLIFVYLVGVILDHTGSWWVAGLKGFLGWGFCKQYKQLLSMALCLLPEKRFKHCGLLKAAFACHN